MVRHRVARHLRQPAKEIDARLRVDKSNGRRPIESAARWSSYRLEHRFSRELWMSMRNVVTKAKPAVDPSINVRRLKCLGSRWRSTMLAPGPKGAGVDAAPLERSSRILGIWSAEFAYLFASAPRHDVIRGEAQGACPHAR